jgi:carbonic anhydrase
MATAGVAVAGTWAASGALSPGLAATTVTPAEALVRLQAGNEKFMTTPQGCNIDLRDTRNNVAKAQSPWAAILTCADSRVPPELIFGCASLGEFFVARNAGNIADTDVIGTLEYGTEHLGVPLILVLGHQRCGAVQAACDVVKKHTVLPGSIKPMVDAIVPAAQAEFGKPGDFIDLTVRENARRSAEKIKTGSEIISDLMKEGKVNVVYGIYSLDMGAVDILG